MAIATTVAIFGINEMARLTLRTRKYSLTNYYVSYFQVETTKRSLFRSRPLAVNKVWLRG